jgi:hypothetical protein
LASWFRQSLPERRFLNFLKFLANQVKLSKKTPSPLAGRLAFMQVVRVLRG